MNAWANLHLLGQPNTFLDAKSAQKFGKPQPFTAEFPQEFPQPT
jgi:hypothetical protein